MKKADIIIDLQYGSTGKGLIAGHLACTGGYDTVISANMPNAGHTYIDEFGHKYIFKVLPSGSVCPNVKKIMIGPGAIFDIKRLMEEWEQVPDRENKELIIHQSAVVLRDSHREKEKASLDHISSTMQGSGAAMIEKIQRNPTKESPILATAYPYLRNFTATPNEWMQVLNKSRKILVEGAQGYSLGINAGFYPYCTSRDCTPARFMADCAVPLNMLNKVIGTARCHPIRVGSTLDGYSGDIYPDQQELDWIDIGVVPETTTVTGRVRRVFTFSEYQIRDAIMACQPDEIFLNFVNYNMDYAQNVWFAINRICQKFGPEGNKGVAYLGHGPRHQDVQTTRYWPGEEHAD